MVRYLFSIPASVVIAALLFSFMSWMVDNGRTQKPEDSAALQFDMIMVENETQVHRRQRSVPEPPRIPPPPSKFQPKPLSATPEMNTISYDSPVSQLNFQSKIKGIKVQAPNLGKLADNRQLMPVYRVEPNYPTRALRRNIEGYVIVQFDINEEGRPFNVRVIESKPKNIFNREALRAVKRWKYQPSIDNGQPSVVKGQQTKVEFRIAK
ncbi:energy transducer TonB [Vibrio salinus]|uniref:energy transducer TonB n=1 Tax=Vibrio salinus TaxID=2899784 RepID=UPI001E555459|nr:energy transducer TonB [Vibrio salinus]MCE0492513.1 energy transducer TonB [Vibrio salinus]